MKKILNSLVLVSVLATLIWMYVPAKSEAAGGWCLYTHWLVPCYESPMPDCLCDIVVYG